MSRRTRGNVNFIFLVFLVFLVFSVCIVLFYDIQKVKGKENIGRKVLAYQAKHGPEYNWHEFNASIDLPPCESTISSDSAKISEDEILSCWTIKHETFSIPKIVNKILISAQIFLQGFFPPSLQHDKFSRMHIFCTLHPLH